MAVQGDCKNRRICYDATVMNVTIHHTLVKRPQLFADADDCEHGDAIQVTGHEGHLALTARHACAVVYANSPFRLLAATSANAWEHCNKLLRLFWQV